MAIGAAQVSMRTDQRESILLVQFRDRVHDPIHRGMTARAIIAHAHPMHVGVARCAIHGCRIEDQGGVARLAIHFRVSTFQREFRGVVLEDHCRCRGIHQRLLHPRLALVLQDGSFGLDPDERCVVPTRRAVALGAIDGEVLSMRRLGRQPRGGQKQEHDYL